VPDDPDLPAVIRAVIAAIDTAHDQGITAINGATASAEVFAAATELAAHLRRLADSDADLRADIASRIYTARKLSLSSLADHIGVSKARADQLIRNAKKLKEEGS
jgi:parvulin-like peptidyl-prolyl isomerase